MLVMRAIFRSHVRRAYMRRKAGYALVRGFLHTFHKSLLSILEEAGNGFL